MRGLLLLIAAGMVVGCGCSETGLEGQADTTVDTVPELTPDPDPDPDLDPDPDPDPDMEPEAIEDTIEDEWPVASEGCGNAIVEDEEECDDGDLNECNGCSSSCEWERALHIYDVSRAIRVEVENIPCVQCPFTVEMWYRPDQEDSNITLLYIPGVMHFNVSNWGYHFDHTEGGSSGRWDPSVTLTPGTWYHVVFSCMRRDDGGWRFIVCLDGRYWSSGGGPGYIPTWTCDEPMIIGINHETGTGILRGAIDDYRISNEAIYEFEAVFLPDIHPAVRPDTVALWDYNLDVDGVIPDVSGNGHDAVLVDGILVPDDCHLP